MKMRSSAVDGGSSARIPMVSFFLIGAVLLPVPSPVLSAGIKDAPRRTVNRDSETKTSTAGDDVKMSCPIDGTPNPLYEWSKDGELIPEDGWERMRLQGRTLRIKQVTISDHGSYKCTAVNGFGKETYTTHLSVIDPTSGSSVSNIPGGLLPEFTQIYPPSPGKIDKPVGHTIKLKCQVNGVPEPTVTWLKDGNELYEESLGSDFRLSRHSLHLTNLKPQDSGTYTCEAANHLGKVATNWTVRVIDQAMPREPEFYPPDPANTTVVAGEPATLQCRGSSEVTPHIKWLRRLENDSKEALHLPRNETIDFKGHRYVVLKATEVVTPGDGTFYTKMTIPKVTLQDTGVYVCTATNNFGLAYRQARISVISESSQSNILMLILGLACVAVVIVVVALVIALRRAQASKPTPPVGPSESSLLPPPPIKGGKMQPPPPPSHHARYVPQTPAPPNPQQGAPPHGRPEGPLLQYAGGMVHLPHPPPQAAMASGSQVGQPIIVYQDPATVYIAQQPPPAPPASSIGRPEYQYQQLDVI